MLKSGLLLRLQGPAAKAWLRKHVRKTKTGDVVNVGIPGNPIEIPRVDVLTYLGIQLSYGSFECENQLLHGWLMRNPLTPCSRIGADSHTCACSGMATVHFHAVSQRSVAKHHQPPTKSSVRVPKQLEQAQGRNRQEMSEAPTANVA